MKVLILNGSPHADGNTAVAVREMEQVFAQNGVDVETILVGTKDIRSCIACGHCYGTGKCVFDDIVNEVAPKFAEADGLVVASGLLCLCQPHTGGAAGPAVLQHPFRQDHEGWRQRCLRQKRRLLCHL